MSLTYLNLYLNAKVMMADESLNDSESKRRGMQNRDHIQRP